ncbi:dihydrouridine synthase [Geopyxis carbonaria]|nr:dihydrouridine synthase [Geopyxis carbonaria]
MPVDVVAPGVPPRDPTHHPRRLLDAAAAEGRILFVQAPMVRYSKLPFRALMHDYAVDVCYTPMMLAKEFTRSQRARLTEFTTSPHDRPLVVQFAASNATDFARAAEMVAPFADGVNLNCGCPQSWALHDGVGCAMMSQPALVADMVRAAKARCGRDFCVSVKIRVHADIAETLRFVAAVEAAGVDYITVHGRRRTQRSSEPVNLDAIRAVKAAATVPVVANGDVFSLSDALRIAAATGVDGVMAARGLMTNPALFTGALATPWGCVERFWAHAMRAPVPYRILLQHLADMMEGLVTKRERARMMEGCACVVELLEWFDGRYVLRRPGEEGWGVGVGMERRVGWEG